MKVSVIGATGSVGAPSAFHIAASGSVGEVVLIARRSNVAEQHAMDMSTAVASLGVRVRAGAYDDLAGSDVVINAAGVEQGFIADRMELLPKNLPLVREIGLKIRRYCPEAFIITVTNPTDPLNYATWLAGGFDRRQVVGYSLNDSLRFRQMVARLKGVATGRVEAMVMGEHGSSQVLLFSSVRIDGRPVSFNEQEKAGIRAEVPHILRHYEELRSGRTAGWTCAVGLAAMVRAVADDTGEIFPCSCVLQGEYGLTGLSMSVPASLGRAGIRAIEQWETAPEEAEGLERTGDVLRASARIVDEFFKD